MNQLISTESRTFSTLAAWGLCVMLLPTEAALGQGGSLTQLSRDATVGFGDLTFLGAQMDVRSIQQRSYLSPTSPTVIVNLVGSPIVPGSVTVQGTGVTTATLQIVGVDAFSGLYGSTGSGTGSIVTAFSVLPITGGRFDRFVRDGNWVLRVQSVVSILTVSTGTPFTLTQRIPGDWRTIGTQPGQISNIITTAGWAVTDNLTFDGNFTTLRISDSYRQQSSVLSISFDLIGSPVPTPGGAAALALGASFMLRRRR